MMTEHVRTASSTKKSKAPPAAKAAPCAEENPVDADLIEMERNAFEVLAKTEQGLDMTRLPHGGYRSFATHQAWWAWQASRREVIRIQKDKSGPDR